MRALLFSMSLTIASAPQAVAGAWPRDEGTAFVALSSTVSTGARTLLAPMLDLRTYSSVFAEYGLSPNWTIGLDAGYGTGEDDGVTTGLVFLRRPVWRSEGGQIVAAELGLGLHEDETRIRPGLSWGRGFESRWGQGWMGVESSAELRLPTQDVAVKVDGTLGLKPTDRTMLIMQVQSGRFPDSDPIVRLAPSVVRRFGKATHLQLGVTGSVVGDDAYGLKLGTWFNF